MLTAKALASLHICTGSPEPRHSNEISFAGSNGNLCAIYVSIFHMLACSEGSGESAHLQRLTVMNYHVLVHMTICVPFM